MLLKKYTSENKLKMISYYSLRFKITFTVILHMKMQ